jgi:hypothetical protein
MKIGVVGAELLHADGQTDIQSAGHEANSRFFEILQMGLKMEVNTQMLLSSI